MTRSTSDEPPLGLVVSDWTPPAEPDGIALRGRYAELVRLDTNAHARALFAAYQGHDQVWDYLFDGPFHDLDGYRTWMDKSVSTKGQLFYAIKNRETDAWEGVASYLRIDPQSGSIEVGNINYSPALQRTRAGTEAMFLMMQWAFNAGYRRYEWKCNGLNLPSRRAAQRLGFSFEGIFRQAVVVKGRNRDTAWFAAIDREWLALQNAYKVWLAPENFNEGQQCQSLSALTAPIRVSSDPILSGAK
ncbi:MAG: GNAT family N-acetyltransferase [Roseobacter sp.]